MSEQRLALLIGNDTFPKSEGRLSTLRYPINDVNGLSGLLKTHSRFTPKPLKNRTATQVLKATRAALERLRGGGVLLIYYCGHGKRDLYNKFYLATAETDNLQLGTTALAFNALMDMVREFPAVQAAVILDCCLSGMPGARGDAADQINAVRPRGMFIISATGPDELTYERPEDEHGLLTKHVLHGIQTFAADLNRDRRVSMQDLFQYVSVKVPEEGGGHPHLFAEGNADIIIADLPPGVADPPPKRPVLSDAPPVTAWREIFERAEEYRPHRNLVSALCLSMDGRLVASASPDGTVWLRSLADGGSRLVADHQGIVAAIALDRRGRLLACASGDGTIVIWRTEDGGRYRILASHTEVREICFLSDRVLAVGGPGRTACWAFERDEPMETLFSHNAPICCLAASADMRRLALGDADGKVKLYEMSSGRSLLLHGHRADVLAVACSPDGMLLASAGRDCTIILRNLITGAVRLQWRAHEDVVHGLAFSPNGRQLVSAGDKTIRIWDPFTGEGRQTLYAGSRQYCVAFAAEGRLIASGGEHGQVLLWRTKTKARAQPGSGPVR